MRTFVLLTVSVALLGCKPKSDSSCLIRSQGELVAVKEGEKNLMDTNLNPEKSAPAKSTKAKADMPERDTINAEDKWDPSVVFPSVKAWEKERDALKKEVLSTPKSKGLRQFEGTLRLGAARVKTALDKIWAIRLRIERLHYYAARLSHVDMRKSTPLGMLENAKKISTDFEEATSWVEPEFLKLGVARLRAYQRAKTLKDYSRYFGKLIRMKKHVLSKEEERILSLAGVMGYTSYETYSTFSNSDMEFNEITDKEGNKVKLSTAAYVRYRESMVREDRMTVFKSFWSTFKQYRNTFAQTLSGQVKYYAYVAKARNYKDSITAALYPKNIPVKYYTNLISSINANLDAFHDYLSLRKDILGIKGDQGYYDVYPPLVSTKPREYTIEEGKQVVKEALKPLGADYAKLLDEAFKKGSGWLDVYPNKGKRSGAYMAGLYGVHPFLLLNYNKSFNAVSTLAHEIGHAMHSVLSDKTQPYAKSDYVIFNAEVASIVNEALLIEFLLKKEKDPKKRQFLLSYYLDSFRGTVFRQTMFAEFELKMYQAYEKGTALTADYLDNLYLGLLRTYHGHGKDVMKIDDLYGAEWSYIPHFFYNFYVYSYVNGFIAATYLADKILKGGPAAAKKYVDGLLKAGGSKDPLEILKDAGVDMLDPATFKEAINKFRARVKELKKLAGK